VDVETHAVTARADALQDEPVRRNRGYVTRFHVRAAFPARCDVKTVGRRVYQQ
jgi:hypothetical protein